MTLGPLDTDEIERDTDIDTDPGPGPGLPDPAIINEQLTPPASVDAEEKFDYEQSEKQSRKHSGSSNPEVPSGVTNPIPVPVPMPIPIPIPKIGVGSSVFREVPRSGRSAKSDGKVVEAEVGQKSGAVTVTVPVKIIASHGYEEATGETKVEDTGKLPEFVDWSARTTNILYKKLEGDVAKLRCEKQQLQERLDRSLQQTEHDREVVKHLQQELRQYRDKVFDYERQIRTLKLNANRRDEDDNSRKPLDRGANGNNSNSTSTSSSGGLATTQFAAPPVNKDDAAKWQHDQKLTELQHENDVQKRKIDEMEELMRRNDRLMKSYQNENQELRSRHETDSKRFSMFEERVKQLEDALARSNLESMQQREEIQSQLLIEQSRRSQLEQATNMASVRNPPTRKTLSEATTSGARTNFFTALTSSIGSSTTAKSLLSAPSQQYRPEKAYQESISSTHSVGNPSAIGTFSLSSAVTSGSYATGPGSGNVLPESSVSQQPSSQLVSLSSLSSFGLRRHLSLPSSARRQLASRFGARFTADESANGSVNTSDSLSGYSSRLTSGYESVAKSSSSSSSSAYSSIGIASISARKLPAVAGQGPTVVDQTAVQQANRLNLHDYREFLKERRRKLVERDTISFAAPELPAEAV